MTWVIGPLYIDKIDKAYSSVTPEALTFPVG